MSHKHYHVRWMIRQDMTDVIEIENHIWQKGGDTWTENDWLVSLRDRKCIGMVAVFPDEQAEHVHPNGIIEVQLEPVRGAMVFELSKEALTLKRFIVEPSYTNRGVASSMIAKLIGKLSPERRELINISIDDKTSNDALVRFLARRGFKATPNGNAIDMQLSLASFVENEEEANLS